MKCPAISHGTDRNALALKHRALLDMQLDIGVGLQEPRLLGSGIADACQLRAKHGSVRPRGRQCRVDRQSACMDQRAHHIGRVAYALLVGEGNHCNWTRWRKPAFPQSLDHLQAGENAVASVVDPRIDHGIDMRADQQGRPALILAGTPDAEDIADAVDCDIRSRLVKPGDEKVARCPVCIRGCETREPSMFPPYLAELMDAANKPLSVDGGFSHAGMPDRTATSSGAIPTSSA
jgi:hypothetical protein